MASLARWRSNAITPLHKETTMATFSSRMSIVMATCMAAHLLLSAAPARASQSALLASTAAPTRTAEPGAAATPARVGSAASDFALRAPAATASTERPARPPCPQCRRAASGSDLMMFWLMFGGVAKTPPLPEEAGMPAEVTPATRD
jgi:hypothetical protein